MERERGKRKERDPWVDDIYGWTSDMQAEHSAPPCVKFCLNQKTLRCQKLKKLNERVIVGFTDNIALLLHIHMYMHTDIITVHTETHTLSQTFIH